MAVGLSLLASAAAMALATADSASARPASPADSARTPMMTVASATVDSSADALAGGAAPVNPLVTSVSGALTRTALGLSIPRAVTAAPTYRKLTNGRLLADSLVVVKSRRTLTLFYRGDSVATYFVALGKSPVGAKERAGDNKTPEGVYHIDAKNGASEYHRALHVSYPSAADLARAQQLGVTTGGDIMIHGLPPRFHDVGDQHRAYDWTKGCIAVTDQEIEEIFSAVPQGAVVNIQP